MSADHDSPTLAHLVRTIGQEASNLAAVPPIPSSAIVCFDQYVGPGYGEMTEACREAILITARYEGILLDPVYTGKAMAGLIDQIRRGNLRRGQTVIFLHTGGAPALFAYAPELIRAQ
jgi:D-cysteine desulfhydrase